MTYLNNQFYTLSSLNKFNKKYNLIRILTVTRNLVTTWVIAQQFVNYPCELSVFK